MALPVAPIGNDIWVGSYHACNDEHSEYERRIHVWSRDAWGPGLCKICEEQGQKDKPAIYTEKDLILYYSEEHPLDPYLKHIHHFVVEGKGPLLIHCTAGQCRSPTIALAALVASGMDPFEALGSLHAGMWKSRRLVPQICRDNIAEIWKFYKV